MYHSDDIGMALNAQPVGNTGGQSYLYLVDDCLVAAMRGRYDTNGNIHQQLEPQYDRICNTLTSVTKDNLVLEG